MKQNKSLKIILTLCCFLAFSISALASAPQNPPVTGIGVVVKKNPGGGASKATTGKDGSFSLELVKGSYLVSLDKDQLLKAGQDLVTNLNPKSTYVFNGDGTQLVIAENENIIMSQLEGDAGSDLLLITALKPTTLQGSLLWDSTVVNQPQAKTEDRVGHVTLLRRNASQSLQVFCPLGTLGLNGKCVPIKEFENSPQGKSEDRIGHVTLLKKYGSSMKVAETEGGPHPPYIIKGGTHKVKRTGHVTLLRFSKPQIYVGGGISNPSATTKEAGIVNGIDINVSLYKPIWEWGNTSLGINAGGGYTMGNSDYALDSRYTVYQLQGQSAPPTVVAKGNGSPKAQGFKFEAGPQMNIHLGDVTVSPILNAAYLSISQKEFTVTETVQENTVDYPYVLLAQKATKTSGLGVIPKVRLAYNITPTIGIWVEGSYTMGSTISTESTRFVLDPTIPSNSYNLGHFNEGQYITTKTDTKYSDMGISGGVVISLGKKENSGGGAAAASYAATGKVIATSDIVGEWKSLVAAGTPWFISGGSACQLEPGCGAGGIYCKANSPSFSEPNYVLNEDEIMTASAIKLVGTNNIVIYNLGLKNKLTAKTLQKFIDKKVDVQPTVLPLSLLSSLYKSIGLPEPKQPITFGKENITYEVMNTTNEGKDVQVIQINEKTKINIDGKEYNVTVITTSGRGSGSPKQQGF
ncbi:hypothetical protein QWY90_08995 [Flavobacterium paronense]|uniref:Carboxypeptidase regulatory-like domain-containing protein n=1 Tax=Flavobacterium paronense TaxID=1392775 RepID=A0ABV5GAG6_9FLAO|nr:hypothetical protein [Flavobacterium paronense]MDN3677454.1 hypothetical protein [Flavobacterium paronense]